jgi:hypothetical protein
MIEIPIEKWIPLEESFHFKKCLFAGALRNLSCSKLCVCVLVKVWEGKKVKFTLEQATKAQRGSRGIALLLL